MWGKLYDTWPWSRPEHFTQRDWIGHLAWTGQRRSIFTTIWFFLLHRDLAKRLAIFILFFLGSRISESENNKRECFSSSKSSHCCAKWNIFLFLISRNVAELWGWPKTRDLLQDLATDRPSSLLRISSVRWLGFDGFWRSRQSWTQRNISPTLETEPRMRWDEKAEKISVVQARTWGMSGNSTAFFREFSPLR